MQLREPGRRPATCVRTGPGTRTIAAETPDGTVKPAADVTYTDRTAEAATIGHHLKSRKHVLTNFAARRSTIEGPCAAASSVAWTSIAGDRRALARIAGRAFAGWALLATPRRS